MTPAVNTSRAVDAAPVVDTPQGVTNPQVEETTVDTDVKKVQGSGMKVNVDTVKPAVNRLKRAHGQLAAVIAMLEDGRECKDVVMQLAAVSSAVDRAGFAVIADTLQHCMAKPDSEVDVKELEKMFLSLA